MINRLSILAVLSLALVCQSSAAIPLTPGLTYNTGANAYANNSLDTPGSADMFFNLYAYFPAPANQIATVVPPSQDGPGWVTPTTGQWIAPVENQSGSSATSPSTVGSPAGIYDYNTFFATDFMVPTTITVLGSFAADSSATMYVNGAVAGFSAGPTTLTPIDFTFNVGAGPSMLPIDFLVDNLATGGSGSTNPSGLLVENLHFVSTAAPEPSTWALLLGGVASLLFIQRRRFASLL